jgi:glycosyltransferase involved in cell wall biosynthesis
LKEGTPELHGILEIHVWSHETLLEKLPNVSWLFKHSVPKTKSIWKQLFWERFNLSKELEFNKCSLLLNIDAGTTCKFSPAVTMSRDMLSYEAGEISRFRFFNEGLRLLILRYVQNTSLRRANGVIFLTKYASEVIQKSCGNLKNVSIIPHGIGDNFKSNTKLQLEQFDSRQINCLYVSPIWMFKHQWHVVKAIEELRKEGFNLHLNLVGSVAGNAMKILNKQLKVSDPHSIFVTLSGEIEHHMLPDYYKSSDIFIFASSCENMPNTLIEAMGAGLPIACSNKGPMPEILKDGGVYFSPEDPGSIIIALKEILLNDEVREKISLRGRVLAEQYSWRRCANETFSFIFDCYQKEQNGISRE